MLQFPNTKQLFMDMVKHSPDGCGGTSHYNIMGCVDSITVYVAFVHIEACASISFHNPALIQTGPLLEPSLHLSTASIKVEA